MADNKDYEIECPACGQTMQKIYMPEQGINLDVCTQGCGGIYFDNREFQKFDESHEDITPLKEVLKDKTFNKVDETKDRICPVCGMKMVKHFASSKHNVQIDECYSCGGIFLDYMELDKIRKEYNLDEERNDEVLYEFFANHGQEMVEFEQKYNKQMKRQSLLSMFTNRHFNK